MTTFVYPMPGTPSGETIYGPVECELFEPQYASFGTRADAKNVRTAGHARPLISENAGASVTTHLMGIKPPLNAPTVSVEAGGYSGDVQVCVQRVWAVKGAEGTRSGASPLYPSGDTLAAIQTTLPPGEEWDDFAGSDTVVLGVNGTAFVNGFRQGLLASGLAVSVYVDRNGSQTPALSYTVSKVRLYGYRSAGPLDAALGFNVFFGDADGNPIGQVVTITGDGVLLAGQVPIIDVFFPKPVAIDPAALATTYIYIVVADLAPAAAGLATVTFFINGTDGDDGGTLSSRTDPSPTFSSIAGTGIHSIARHSVEEGILRAASTTGLLSPPFSSPTTKYFPIGIQQSFVSRETGSFQTFGASFMFSVGVASHQGTSGGVSYISRGTSSAAAPTVAQVGFETQAVVFYEATDVLLNYTAYADTATSMLVNRWTALTLDTTFNTGTPVVFAIPQGWLAVTADPRGRFILAGAYTTTTGVETATRTGLAGAYGLWKGNGAETTWTRTAFTPNNTNVHFPTGLRYGATVATVYMWSEQGVDKSTDTGDTFASAYRVPSGAQFVTLDSTDGTNLVGAYVTPGNGSGVCGAFIVKSADSGATWGTAIQVAAATASTGQFPTFLFAINRTTTTIFDAVVNGGVFRSTDSGATWGAVTINGTLTPARSPLTFSGIVHDPASADYIAAWYGGVGTISTNNITNAFTDAIGLLEIVATNATTTDFTTPDIYFKLGQSQTNNTEGNTIVFLSLTNNSLVIDTAIIEQREPEAEADGGTEHYNSYAILIRDRVAGSEWRDVGLVERGKAFTFDMAAADIFAYPPLLTEFYECPGGFDDVENYRAQGSERLCFVGQPGYDPFVGIPGKKDYTATIEEPQFYTENGKFLLLGRALAQVTDYTGGFVYFRLFDPADAALLTGQLQIAYLDRLGNGALAQFYNFAPASEGRYTAQFSAPTDTYGLTVNSTMYMGYPAAHTIGQVLALGAPAAGFNGRYNGLTQITLFEPQEPFFTDVRPGTLCLGQANADDTAVTYFTFQKDSLAGNDYLFVDPAQVRGAAVSLGMFVRLGLSELDYSTTNKLIAFNEATGAVRSRAFLYSDGLGTGLISVMSQPLPFGSTSFTPSPGVRGPSPVGVANAQVRYNMYGTVTKGSTRVQVFLPVIDDWWQQRQIQFDGDNAKGTIKKVLKFNPDTGAPLALYQLELFEPWGGDSHNFSLMQLLSDYSSVHFSGSTSDTYEVVSGLLKYNLTPSSRTMLLKATRGTMYVVCNTNEIFQVIPSNFLFPTTFDEFANSFIDITNPQNVQASKETAVFTCSSLGCAVDDQGRLYFGSPQGIYQWATPNARLIPGMRDRFRKFNADCYQRISLAFDGGAFPFPQLQVGGLSYTENNLNVRLAWLPDIERWLDFSGAARTDALCAVVGRDNGSRIAFAGSSKLGLLGQCITELDYTEFAGDTTDSNLFVNGQYRGALPHGFITGADATLFDADLGVWALDLTYHDSTADVPVPFLGLQALSSVYNCTLTEAGQPVLSTRGRVQIGLFDAATGAVQLFDIVGFFRNEAVTIPTNTLYILAPDGVVTTSSSQKFYWAFGPRYVSLVTPEIRPATNNQTISMESTNIDPEPNGTATFPFWITYEVFGSLYSGTTNTKVPIRGPITVPWTSFASSNYQAQLWNSLYAQSVSVKISGYAPLYQAFRIKNVVVQVQDGGPA